MDKSSFFSEADLNDFQRKGYVVVRRLFTAQEAQELASWVDEVQRWPEQAGRHMMYFEKSQISSERILNRLENFVPYHRGLGRLINGPRMLGLVSQLFGEAAVLFKDKINFKLPGGDGFAAHQDVQAGWSRYAKIHITGLISVDRATVDNGCLHIAQDFPSRTLIGAEWTPLDEKQLAGVTFAPIETEPGDAVFFDSFVPHSSKPNLTDQARRILYITFNKASEGDRLMEYYADKRKNYPPDVERQPGKEYVYRV